MLFGLESAIEVPLILFITGALAGFVDAIVGGGGLISLPALLLTNLPISMALGTNKLASSFGAVTAMITYARKGFVEWRLVKRMMPFSFVISMVGAVIAIIMPPVYLKPVIILLLFAVLLVVIFKKSFGDTFTFTYPSLGKIVMYILGAMGLALYDGFIGPGTGMFLIFYFIYIGFDFIRASSNAKVLNSMSNLGSLCVFLYLGQVNFIYGLAMGMGQMVGATAGAKLAMNSGTKLVRAVFIISTVAMLIKLSYDYLLMIGIL